MHTGHPRWFVQLVRIGNCIEKMNAVVWTYERYGMYHSSSFLTTGIITSCMNRKSLMAEWLEHVSQWREMSCHGPEVMFEPWSGRILGV